MSDFRDALISFAHRLEDESNAAHDLWSWLPSYEAAKKYHGDHAGNFAPSIADVMREASKVLSVAAGYGMTDEERAEWFRCPCDEEHADEVPR